MFANYGAILVVVYMKKNKMATKLLQDVGFVCRVCESLLPMFGMDICYECDAILIEKQKEEYEEWKKQQMA